MEHEVKWPLEFDVTLRETELKNPNYEQWLFIHPKGKGYSNQLHLLPLNLFPITRKVNRKGILVTCVDARGQEADVIGAFHRFDGNDRFGYERFYLGTAGATKRIYTQQWKDFIKRFGVSRQYNPQLDLKLRIYDLDESGRYVFKIYDREQGR